MSLALLTWTLHACSSPIHAFFSPLNPMMVFPLSRKGKEQWNFATVYLLTLTFSNPRRLAFTLAFKPKLTYNCKMVSQWVTWPCNIEMVNFSKIIQPSRSQTGVPQWLCLMDIYEIPCSIHIRIAIYERIVASNEQVLKHDMSLVALQVRSIGPSCRR